MKFKPENHIIGKAYDLTQENMNALILIFEKLSEENNRLKEALTRIEKECYRHDTTAWGIASDALEEK